MPIRWKVVTVNRKSCFCGKSNSSIPAIDYPLNVKVTAIEDSMGMFLFDTKANAALFTKVGWWNRTSWIVIKVMAHGRGHRLRLRPTNFEKGRIADVRGYLKNKAKLFSLLLKDTRWQTLTNELPGVDNWNLKYKDDGTMVYDSVTPLT